MRALLAHSTLKPAALRRHSTVDHPGGGFAEPPRMSWTRTRTIARAARCRHTCSDSSARPSSSASAAVCRSPDAACCACFCALRTVHAQDCRRPRGRQRVSARIEARTAHRAPGSIGSRCGQGLRSLTAPTTTTICGRNAQQFDQAPRAECRVPRAVSACARQRCLRGSNASERTSFDAGDRPRGPRSPVPVSAGAITERRRVLRRPRCAARPRCQALERPHRSGMCRRNDPAWAAYPVPVRRPCGLHVIRRRH